MSNNDTCDIFLYDKEKVDRIKNNMNTIDLSNIIILFKAISEVNRAKITYALCEEEELCVCDIANIIGASIANTSHHLRTLYKQGIVNYRKEGKLAFYSLYHPQIKQLMMVILDSDKEVKVDV